MGQLSLTSTAPRHAHSQAGSNARLRVLAERRSQLWLSILAAAGWIGLVTHEIAHRVAAGSNDVDASVVQADHGHGHMEVGSAGSGSVVVDVTMQAVMWAAMIAIMLPLIAPNVRFVTLRSPVRERQRVACAIVAGWSIVWAAAAVLLAICTWLAVQGVGQVGAIAVLIVVAVGWHLSPVKRRSAARCHRTFAPPLDADEASVECRRFGTRLGVDCVASCWALMAVMGAAGHSVLAVAPLFWVSWYERRRRPHHDPRTATTAGVMVCTGVALIAVTSWLGLG